MSAVRLKIIEGPDRGSEFTLGPGRTLIGRDGENPIRLNSRTVSRHHADIISLPHGEIRIEDGGSANGILVNGERVRSQTLFPGDSITIGEFRLQVVTDTPDPRTSSQTVKEAPAAGPARDSIVVQFLRQIGSAVRALGWSAQIVTVVSLSLFLFLLLVVAPAVSRVQGQLLIDGIEKGRLLAESLAQKNAPIVPLQNPVLLDCESVLKEKGVQKAYILDSESRILCPGSLDQIPLQDALNSVVFDRRAPIDNCHKRILELGENSCSLLAPILHESKIVGAARILFDPGAARQSVTLDSGISRTSLLVALLIAFGLISLLVYFTRGAIVHLRTEIDQAITVGKPTVNSWPSLPGVADLIPSINILLERSTYAPAASEAFVKPAAKSIDLELLESGLMGRYLVVDEENTVLLVTPEFRELTRLDSLTNPISLSQYAESAGELRGDLMELVSDARISVDGLATRTLVIEGAPCSVNARRALGSQGNSLVFVQIL